VLNEKWQEKGIFFINDIMKTNGNGLMSVEELDLKYQITDTRFWKRLIQNSARLLSVAGSNMEHFDKIINCIKPCKTFHNICLKKYTERSINSQNKWENRLKIKEVKWDFVYILSNDCTLHNTLKVLQYKLLRRTIPTNTFCMNVG
jgi:hypothetical protein